MSFIQETKLEVLNKIKILKPDALSFLFALFKTCGEFDLRNEQVKFLVNSDNFLKVINKCLKNLELDEANLEICDEMTFNSTFKYEIILSKKSSRFLFDKFKNENFEDDFIRTKTQKLSFIKAVFLTSSTSTIVLNSDSQSYSLEFVFQDYDFSEFYSELLANFDIISKKIARKNQFVVYINKLDFICDFFALINATNAVLNLQNESAVRNLRNTINRQNNCMEANINKTVNASVKQINAIKTIERTVGLDSLDYNLQEICLLRLANPEESLEQLLKLLNNKISKSGLNHRLNKIIKIAEMLE